MMLFCYQGREKYNIYYGTKGGECAMTINWGKVVKGLVTVAGIGVSLASSYFADKELDAKIDKKMAEALAEAAGKEA